ncbi:ATP-binding cassette domain-containing protein [Photobacterium leiognathi]|uniref:ATP-binding cassette domain-containing protein n=1 Tax=Photobacterium leiognathi TaxID=553611 RepID=UPI0027348923|nr:ATP-binding cassette domain-containing protein [Photobacterium leiognathi]
MHSDSSLSACIKQGQHLAISGVSGCGKSSLLQVIAGINHLNRVLLSSTTID